MGFVGWDGIFYRLLRVLALDHLFVHVDYQRALIGKKLLDDAKARSPQGLTLYTFKRNTGAQQFYLSQGFVETARGFDSFDRNP